MKIIEEYNNSDVENIEIKSAQYEGNFIIKIFFSDGLYKMVDFLPFLKQSLHPSICKYLNEKLFKNYQITNGNLNWNDYDMIFPLEDLYEGKI